MSLGQPADTPPEDLMLLEQIVDEQGRFLGARPAKAVVAEYQRVHRWLAKECAAHGSPD